MWLVTAVAALGACSSQDPAVPGGPDAAVVRPDAPERLADAAPIDADLDAPTDTPFVACTGSATDVYGIAASSNAPLGTILACAPAGTLALADAQNAIGSGVTATSAVNQFEIAYQTRDGSGNPAVTTARVYLPSTPRAKPVPLVAAGHGSVGLADSCAPSTGTDDNLSLPFAARGFAVIAPDLAGLGNAGTQDYLDNRAQGHQMLDGVRALRLLLAPGITAQTFLLSGYSQGGGAALSAQALARTDGSDLGTLAATVVYAPEWPIRMNSFQYLDILNTPNELVVQTGLSFSSVMVMRAYAFFEDHVGVGMGKTTVPSTYQAELETAIQSQCLVELGAYIEARMLHTDDLMDATLRADFLACANSNGSAAQCTADANASAYYQFLAGNFLGGDPHAGPIMLVQGGLDQIMPPASEAACVVDKLATDGVDVDSCVYATATHTDIMNNHPFGVAWAESILDGGPRAQCGQGTSLPACTP
jgi:pimeloyl-ACP methyl ester carboxylesterase